MGCSTSLFIVTMVRPLFEIKGIKRTVLCATVGDSPAVCDRRRVTGANSLSAVGYLFSPVYTIQPFVKPVVKPVWQPVERTVAVRSTRLLCVHLLSLITAGMSRRNGRACNRYLKIWNASITNASYDVMFLFLATLSLYRRDRLLLYEFWASTSCKTRSLSVEDQLRPRPL